MLCTHIIANAGAKVINKAQDSRHKIKGAGFKDQGSRTKVQGIRPRAQGPRHKDQGTRFKVHGARPRLKMLKFVISAGI
jgi:hypothetical protein